MAYFLAPIFNDQQVDSNGAPLSGGSIYTYLAGTSSAYPTYTDNTGLTPQANPIVLNSLGLPSSPIWLTGSISYKFTIRDALGVLQRTIDSISGINDASVSISQWVTFGSAPTYISATSFSVAGDQTGSFQIGRRIQATVTAGVVYGTITAAVFGTVTTVTVTIDSGALDSGLSAVSLGLLTAKNPSIPASLTTPLITPLILSGTAVQFANVNVAADPTASNIWVSNRVTLTGSAVTFTNFPAAPQAGCEVELYCNAAHVFTNNANLILDGAANYTAVVGDRIRIRAQSTTVFELHPIRMSPYSSTTLIGETRYATNAEAQAGSNTASAITPAALNTAILGGQGQTLTNVTGSRAFGTTYTNSTGRPIWVIVYSSTGGASPLQFTISGYINSSLISYQSLYGTTAGYAACCTLIVQNGVTYSVSQTNLGVSTVWLEMR
jgi:hypothetical protein